MLSSVIVIMSVLTPKTPRSVLSGKPVPYKTDFRFLGDIPPLGFFDPLGLSEKNNAKYLREAELQHGRLAMLATVIIPTIELFDKDGLGINFLYKMSLSQQLPFWYVFGLVEFYRMVNGWKNPFAEGSNSVFTLKDDSQPGNLLIYNMTAVTSWEYNSELSYGRLAMLAAAHIIGYEALTQNQILHL